jgi:hypothetical protein
VHGALIDSRLGNGLHIDGEEYRNMPSLNLIVPLVVVGVVLWLINQYIPMASSIKRILNVVVVVLVGVWVLQAMGLWGPITTYHLNGR